MMTAEKHIANCATSSVDYAFNFLEGAWTPEMEDAEVANTVIAQHPTAASAYRLGR
jgi:hypothetical protein